MRKLIWYSSAAAVLAAGGFLSLAYYACCCPQSLVGRSMQLIAEASVAMQPLNGLTSLALRGSRATGEAASAAIEQGIPDDPQPVTPEELPEPKEEVAQHEPVNETEWEAAPIIIREDDPLPNETIVPTVPAVMEPAPVPSQELPPNGCPIVMPLCQDDDDSPVTQPRMPCAEENGPKPARSCAKKTSGSSEEAESSNFKEWMKLFKEDKEAKPTTVEELPPPTEEEPQSEGKCQEDSHRHEQYPGCPRVTCPYSGKPTMEQHSKRAWDLDPKMNKKGKEETSEEPPQPSKKPHPDKEKRNEEVPLRTQGVDTMEYRPSDGGLNEYGPGPLQ